MTIRCDILIAGAGLAGLSAALALARSGREIVVAGPLDLRPTARTVALLDGSMRFFHAIGLRGDIEAHGAPLRVMRIVDDTSSLFRTSPAEFDAGEIGLDAFGWNIENARLLDILAQAARNTPNIRVRESLIARYDFAPLTVTATLSDGDIVEAALLAACDGAHSLARQAAGIGVRTWTYPQTAMTAVLRHTQSHEFVSTEFHTREGPCTFVPLPDASDGRYRSSLVWVMHPRAARRRGEGDTASLSAAIERAAHSIYGAMELERGPGFVPMEGLQARSFAGPRIALVSETAHAFPPIGAQGLNLGLRDVAHLCEAANAQGSADPGAKPVLDRYESLRRADIVSRTFGVDLLNRSLLSRFLPVDFSRGAGLMALTHIGPLRRFAMREGVLPCIGAPHMMKSGASSQPKTR